MNEEKEINTIIEKSGNTFHYGVAEGLRKKGWTVMISPYFTDNLTDKPREIDIIAERSFDTNDMFGRKNGAINIQILIECKKVDDLTVFWFDQPDRKELIGSIVREINIDTSETYDIESTVKSLAPNHRHLKDEVAKLFTAKSSNKQEQEFMFKAINQSLNSMIYFRKRGSIIHDSSSRRFLQLPVILVDSFKNFYRADSKRNIDNNFSLEINYAYTEEKRSRTEYFLIDIVDYNKLDLFLTELEKNEISYIRELLSFKNWEEQE